MSNMHPTNIGGELGCLRRVSSSCFLKDTRHVTKKKPVQWEKKENIYVKSKRSIVIWDIDIS
jgi:hypothetical protein